MMNDELKKIWNSSPQVEQVKFEKSRLILEIESNMDTLHKKIRLRDFMETLAALIVILMFGHYAFVIPYPVTKIASILIVVWACYVVVKLRQTNKSKPSAYHENYLTYLEKNKQYLQKQKKLLDDIFWWYIAPFLFFLVLFVLGLLGDSEKIGWILFTLISGGLLSLLIYFLNKRYSKKEYESRINKIEDLIKVMKSKEL